MVFLLPAVTILIVMVIACGAVVPWRLAGNANIYIDKKSEVGLDLVTSSINCSGPISHLSQLVIQSPLVLEG